MTEAQDIWQVAVPVRVVLQVTTVVTLLGYVGYLAYSLTTLPQSTPSVSQMIEYSKGTTITFTLLVFVHGYGLMAYLVIVSEYIGLRTLHFKIVAACCVGYLAALVVVTYVPMDSEDDKVDTHSVFALLAFGFALGSTWVHRHGIVDRALVAEEWSLLVVEVVFVVVVTLCGILFWAEENTVAEYIFIFLIIIDKEVKILMLQETGLLNVDDSYLIYTYRTPPSKAMRREERKLTF
jgi:hypothetical protein